MAVEELGRPHHCLAMANRIHRLQVLQQGFGGVPHAHPEHTLVIPGALHCEQPEQRAQLPVHNSTAMRTPTASPPISHLSREPRPEARTALLAAAASPEPIATRVKATAVCRSSRMDWLRVEASTNAASVRVNPRTASRKRAPYCSRRIALLSPAASAAARR